VEVRCLARDPRSARAAELGEEGAEVVRADALDRESLEPALDGVDLAYYLVHSMGRGAGDDFAERDRRAATNFAAAASSRVVGRIVYLGGLGEGTSAHLRSRHETAVLLGESDAKLTYFRAAVVLGSGSESFRTIHYLAKRLPVMLTPRWTNVRTQPIAARDLVAYLAAAGDVPASADREIEIGGPDVTTYGGLLDETARALGRRAPVRIGVPALSPRLSALWLGLITPVDTGVARPLIEGLTTETVVSDESGMALFEVERTPLREAIEAALRDVL
jgi:uncharacterized protein YbjT (DUF2867 family)